MKFERPTLPPTTMAATYQVVYHLAQQKKQLWDNNYVLFLDNLFSHVDLVLSLLQVKIGVMGTTRRGKEGVPADFGEILENNRKKLIYNSTLSVVEDVGYYRRLSPGDSSLTG